MDCICHFTLRFITISLSFPGLNGRSSHFALCRVAIAIANQLRLYAHLSPTSSLNVSIFTPRNAFMAFTDHYSASAIAHVNKKGCFSLMATASGLSDCAECMQN